MKQTIKSISLIVTIFSLLMISCKNQSEQDLEWALDMAKGNRQELEKVIKYYSKSEKDTLKYKAACFLITKILPYENTVLTPQIDKLKVLENRLKNSLTVYKGMENDKNLQERQRVIDTIVSLFEKEYGRIKHFQMVEKKDIEIITASFLIENIEYAFKAWQEPWSKSYNFKQFCNYILPYKVGNQPLMPWRKYFYDNLKSFRDSIKNVTNPIEVCGKLNAMLKKQKYYGKKDFYRIPYFLSGPMMYECKVYGNCVSMSNLTIEMMRSIGLSVTEVYWFRFGNSGKDHISNTILLPNGEWKYFDPISTDYPGPLNVNDKVTKFYRKESVARTPNTNELKALTRLNLFKWKDITTKVAKETFDIKISIKDDVVSNHALAYLCVFNANYINTWVPVDWTEVKNGNVTFNDINGKEVIYIIMVENGEHMLLPATKPFVLKKDGNLKFITKKAKYSSFSIKRKFPQKEHLMEIAKFLEGGVFEASNNRDFKNTRAFFSIQGAKNGVDGEIINIDIGKYRYYRFKYPKIKEKGKYDLAKIAFYETTDMGVKELKGKYIYSKGCTDEVMQALFDEDLLSFISVRKRKGTTNFYTYYSVFKTFKGIDDEVWVGMDFEKPIKVSKVRYVPRTDKNGVYPNMWYELFYWNNQWTSLGKKQIKNDELIYNNIPEGALLWLKNHTEGKEERIFTIENKEQIWW